MDELRQLCEWPTCLWAGMIAAVFVALTILTLTDNKSVPKWLVDYFDLHSEVKKGKH